MEREELAAWLRLVLTPGIGNETARRLLAAYGLPQDVFTQSRAALEQFVTPAQAKALQLLPPDAVAQLESTESWLAQADPAQGQRAVITLGDALYPESLLAMGRVGLCQPAFGAFELGYGIGRWQL